MPEPIITPEAEQNLNEILTCIVADNFEASVVFFGRLERVFRMLGQTPLAGRERRELNEGLRSFTLGNYMIFYRIWAGKVSITRVLHSARDLDELFS